MAHPERALDHDLSNIQRSLAKMGQNVMHMLDTSVKALVDRDSRLAEEVIQYDKDVDAQELQIDQAIYELIALRQPTASDLRLLIAGIKINNDLERVGDYCEGICWQILKLNKTQPLDEVADLVAMGGLVKRMLSDSFEAYKNKDVALAKQTICRDDEVDQKAFSIRDKIYKVIKEKPELVESASSILLIASKMERIADQSTNISEEIVFSVTGNDIRHRANVVSVIK